MADSSSTGGIAAAELGRAVALPGDRAVVPQICACCAADGVRGVLERRGASDVFIPYCDGCLLHAASGFTRNLATALSSVLLSVAFSLALPLWSDALPLGWHVTIAVGAASVPVAMRLLLSPRRRPGHTASGRAAFWQVDGTLGCTNATFATALARANSVECHPARVREPRIAVWLFCAPLLAAVLAPLGYGLHNPRVRVVNLSAERIALRLDGRTLGTVMPSSAESPAAGAVLRIPAGERTLTVVSDERGQVLSEVRVTVVAGAMHLFAPGSDGTCFWLEETLYGRVDSEAPRLEPLTGSERFWVVPDGVDTWFAPNPPADEDGRSSGGSLLAIRQAPCNRAPSATDERAKSRAK